MIYNGKRLLVCNCDKTMQIDGKRLARALGSKDELAVNSQLCRAEVGNFTSALEEDTPVLVCCTQEAPLFREIAAESNKAPHVGYTNIRERAGWCADKSSLDAKFAALIAEATLDIEPAGSTTLTSDGTCLVYGEAELALEVAENLQGRLNVSLLLSEFAGVTPPSTVAVPINKGRIVKAQGHLGAFTLTIDGHAPASPSSRSELSFMAERNGATSHCSIIIDASGGEPLFPRHAARDGYFHVDASDRIGLAQAMFAASDLVGEFEKPLYVTYDASICAHSRSRKTGCSRCLDACPASAIASQGDIVAFDANICGGCGTCAAVCPTGAAGYNLPSRKDLVARLQALVPTYRKAGGKAATILFHDEVHGASMISMLSRHTRGLPANVLPFAVNQVTQLGHEVFAAAFASGAASVLCLIDPRRRDEIDGLREQVALTGSVISAMSFDGADERLEIIDERDPEAVEQILWRKRQVDEITAGSFVASANKRETARTAFLQLNAVAPQSVEVIALDKGAPYGRINVETSGCTLCLACVSACPMGAIRDNADQPQVRFVEQDCVQCGLCAASCPEQVIRLEPRLNLGNEVLSAVVLHEEEPAECIRCGKAFGTKSSIERIVQQLAGKHSMFTDESSQALIRMCDDCRIVHQAEGRNDPLALGQRPAVRRTEDYLMDDGPDDEL